MYKHTTHVLKSKASALLVAAPMLLASTGCDQIWNDVLDGAGNATNDPGAFKDQDHDMVPDCFDCAPKDPSVHKHATRACRLESGVTGEQSCLLGDWGTCEPSSNAECVQGESREVACVRCGVQTEVCVDGQWSAQGECREQGVCEAGETTEIVSVGHYSCSTGIRTVMACDNECKSMNPVAQTVMAGCREDQCCDGRNCDDAPFRMGCTPMTEVAEAYGIENIVYVK